MYDTNTIIASADIIKRQIDNNRALFTTIEYLMQKHIDVHNSYLKTIVDLIDNDKIKALSKDAQALRVQHTTKHNRFNIFKISSKIKSSYEDFHSDIMRWILDPHKQHGLGNRPMQLFCEFLNKHKKNKSSAQIKTDDFNNATITREHSKNVEGYIDILITGNSDSIIIENKINRAKDQERQLARYYEAKIKKVQAVVYITPTGNEPSYSSTDNKTRDIKPLLITIPAFPVADNRNKPDLINGWLKPLMAEAIHTVHDLDIISFFRQYILLLEQLGGEMNNEKLRDDFIESITDDKVVSVEKFDAALCIKEILDNSGDNLFQNKIYNDLQEFNPQKYDNCVFFRFARGNDEIGLDIWPKEYGKKQMIELYIYGKDGKNNEPDKSRIGDLKRVLDKHNIKDFILTEKFNDRLYYKACEGIPYAGHEQEFYAIVENIIKKLRTS